MRLRYRHMVQLLPSTAKDPSAGIPGIEDLEKNVHAGTNYMAFLRDRDFSDPALQEQDRFAFTWAVNASICRSRQ